MSLVIPTAIVGAILPAALEFGSLWAYKKITGNQPNDASFKAVNDIVTKAASLVLGDRGEKVDEGAAAVAVASLTKPQQDDIDEMLIYMQSLPNGATLLDDFRWTIAVIYTKISKDEAIKVLEELASVVEQSGGKAGYERAERKGLTTPENAQAQYKKFLDKLPTSQKVMESFKKAGISAKDGMKAFSDSVDADFQRSGLDQTLDDFNTEIWARVNALRNSNNNPGNTGNTGGTP